MSVHTGLCQDYGPSRLRGSDLRSQRSRRTRDLLATYHLSVQSRLDHSPDQQFRVVPTIHELAVLWLWFQVQLNKAGLVLVFETRYVLCPFRHKMKCHLSSLLMSSGLSFINYLIYLLKDCLNCRGEELLQASVHATPTAHNQVSLVIVIRRSSSSGKKILAT